MTATSPPEPTPAGASSILARLRRRYDHLDNALRIRWPYFAFLEPLPVLGYVLVSWAVAPVLAFRLRGTILNPLDPTPLSLAWLLLSLLVDWVWLSRQWKARTSLPRPVALPQAWSFVPTVAILLLVLSPTIVWEQCSFMFSARGFERAGYWGGRWYVQAESLTIAMFTAAVMMLAGVVPVIHLLRGLLWALFLSFAVYFLSVARVLEFPAWSSGHGHVTILLVLAFPIAVAGMLVLLLRLAPRARRRPWMDTAFVLVWLSPFVVLAVETAAEGTVWRTIKGEPTISSLITNAQVRSWVDYTSGLSNTITAIFLVYALSSPFAPPALTRYRRLPYTE